MATIRRHIFAFVAGFAVFAGVFAQEDINLGDCHNLVVRGLPKAGVNPIGEDVVRVQLFAKPRSSNDEVFMVFGDSMTPMSIECSDPPYNPLGVLDPISNENLNANYPSDSYCTIGLDGPNTGGTQDEVLLFPEFNDLASNTLNQIFGGVADGQLNYAGEPAVGWGLSDQVGTFGANAECDEEGLVFLAQISLPPGSSISGVLNYKVMPSGNTFNGFEVATVPFLIDSVAVGLDEEFFAGGDDYCECYADVAITGCLDDAACNYDENAECAGDEVCTYPGCTDLAACNYDATAACADNDSCTFPGCQIPEACNYDENAGCANDESCTFPGCVYPSACNYDENAGCDDGSCTFPGCTDSAACNFDGEAGCDNGSCTYPGCTDETACNFDSDAACDDGSCTFPGCIDNEACNYDAEAGCDDGSCSYPGCTDASACNFDDSAGCADASCTYPGCTDETACNFNEDAGCDDGSCSAAGCTDSAACNYDANATCSDDSCTYPGCTDETACNYDAGAECDDGSCTFPGCMDMAACNFDDNAGCDDGSCTFPGCTDSAACNYDANAGCDNESCLQSEPYLDCDGNCLNDCDNDGVCDELEVHGCTYPGACNFNEAASEEDGTCEFESCRGCTDETACNYDATALIDDGHCAELDACGVCGGPGAVYECGCNNIPEGDCDCDGNALDAIGVCGGTCEADEDGNGVCDDFILCLGNENDPEECGCTYPDATNYGDDWTYGVDPAPTVDDGSCEFSCNGDYDGDGWIDLMDLLAFLNIYHRTCDSQY